jgi:hypothetical protein
MNQELVFAVLVVLFLYLVFSCTCGNKEGLASTYAYVYPGTGPHADPTVKNVTDSTSQAAVTTYNFGTGAGQTAPYSAAQTIQDAADRTVNYRLKKVYRPINTSALNAGAPKYGGTCYTNNSQMVVQVASGLDATGNQEDADYYMRDCAITSTTPNTSGTAICVNNKKRYPYPTKAAIGGGVACDTLPQDTLYGPATNEDCGNRDCVGDWQDETCAVGSTPPSGYDCVSGKLVNISTGLVRQKYVVSVPKLGTGVDCPATNGTLQDSSVRGAAAIDCSYSDWQYAI